MLEIEKDKTRSIRFVSGNNALEVSSAGGRVVSFSVEGREALLTQGVQTGSTFWPAPQALWGWPPLRALDSDEYKINVDRDCVSFVSPIEAGLGLQVTKSVKPIEFGFCITYTLKNCGSQPQSVAPWEITRLSGGLTFWGGGDVLAHSNLAVKIERECCWYDYNVNMLSENSKVFCNTSRGWLANVNNGVLLLKRFACVSAQDVAPEEGEIEIYAHGDKQNPYIEVEQQGEYGILPSGEARSWPVLWSAHAVPDSVPVFAGSPELLAFVARFI